MDALERLYNRFVPHDRLVTPELAQTLTHLSQETRRQIGIILSRKGSVEYVVVGGSTSLFLPELGRIRAGKSRFRGIRLIHTHLHGEPINNDDLTDLSLLSLDYVAVLDARPDRNPLTLSGAYLLPVNPENRQFEFLQSTPVHLLDLDFDRFLRDLENEFSRKSRDVLGKLGEQSRRAILVHLDDGRDPDPEWVTEELQELARTAGLSVVETVVQRRRPDAHFFIGKGRLNELVVRAMQKEVDLLVFCPDLSPGQVKAISTLADVRVVDRTQLILDIFAQRAASRGGKLQVELAQLRYLLPRLLGAGKAMARLTAGVGARGPGETKLETDRRKIHHRISSLEKQLEELASQRRERRRRRERQRVPVVSIVGYTNAGKSTLLNTLTHAEALAEDMLFATLDPYSRRLRFPRDREVILTDTVGFIRDLPADLKKAFRATLEELETAQVLVHVVDASSPRAEQQLESVERLLLELELGWVPRITVFNKIDKLPDPTIAANLAQRYGGFAVSAMDRGSLGPLVAALDDWIWRPDEANQPSNEVI